MAVKSGRFIGSISSFVAAGGLFAAAIIVGLIPYSEGGYSGLCPSAFQSMFGGMNAGQSLVNFFSGGRCTTYVSTMTTIMFVLLALAVAALVVAILMRRRKAAGYPYQAAGQSQAPYQGPVAPGVPAQPGYAPMAGEAPGDPAVGYSSTASGSPAAGAWSTPAATGTGNGSFDTRLLLMGVGAVAGIVLVSFAVQWLSFLPGILQLLVWTAVGLTVIWQVARKRAGNDPVKLAEAEKWNPSVVARRVVAGIRNEIDVLRSGPQTVRPNYAPPATPQMPAEQYREPDVH